MKNIINIFVISSFFISSCSNTVEQKNTVLENHSIAIKDGKIEAILPTGKAAEKYTSNKEHNLQQHALIPGLINAHTHASMSLLRGLADDKALMDWLNNLAARQRKVAALPWAQSACLN
mgnify:CR=1 FL=1